MTPDIIKSVQTKLKEKGLYSDAIDGIAGLRTWKGIIKALWPEDAPIPTVKDSLSVGSSSPVDPRSEKNISTLLPEVQNIARAFIHDLNSRGCIAKIISGTRTYDEQTKIYNQGRTTPGPIVTNAPAGYSNHNFGIAFDIGFFDKDGGYIEDGKCYDDAGPIGEAHGLSWGGRWKNQDKPHFEFKPEWAKDLSESQMVAELRNRKNKGRDVFA